MASTKLAKDLKLQVDPQLHGGFLLGEVVVLPNEGEVICDGKRHHLPPKAMEILLVLAQYANQVVSAEQLLEFGWAERKTQRSYLSSTISEIRHALDDHKECPEFIQTLARKGYRLIAEVKLLDKNVVYPNIWPLKNGPVNYHNKSDNQHWHLSLALLKNSRLFKVTMAFVVTTWVVLQVFELLFPIFNIPDWGLKIAVLILVIGFPMVLLFTWLKEMKARKSLMTQRGSEREKKFFFRQLAVDFSFIGALSIAVGFVALYLIESIEVDKAEISLINSNSALVASQDDRIAILPFQFDSQTELPNYFKSTLQGELMNALSKQEAFNLISQRAVNELPLDSSLNDYVKKLNARYLLDGKVASSGNTIKIMLTLVDTNNSVQLWSNAINGSSNRLLTLQQEVNRQVFNAFKLMANVEPGEPINVISTNDFKAYDSYIQGKQKLAEAQDQTALREAEKYFLNAMAYDNQFTLASAGLCQTYLDLYQATQEISSFESAQSQCAILTQNQQLKAEGLVAMANLNRLSGKHQVAIDFYKQALVSSPRNIEAISGMAQSHSELNNRPQAEALLKQTILLEPGYWKNYLNLGDFYYGTGQYSQASQEYAKSILLKPKSASILNRLGATYYLNGDLEKASDAWIQSLEIEPNANNFSNLATAQFFSHQFELAEKNYLQAITMKPADPILWGNLGDAQKFAKKPENAQAAYQKALAATETLLQVNPNDLSRQIMKARYLSELNRCGDAQKLTTSVKINQLSDPYLFYDLAIIAINCQQLQQAQEFVARAVNLGYSEKLILKDIQFQKLVKQQKENQ